MSAQTNHLTDHFDWSDVTNSVTASRLGIDNSLPPELHDVAVRTATKLEKVRALLNTPVLVDSWYRSLALNTALASKPTSQHIKCEAVDFRSPNFGTPADICKAIIAKAYLIGFDQLILEHTWVHISWNSIPGGVQRGQVLSLLASGGYSTGLTDAHGVQL